MRLFAIVLVLTAASVMSCAEEPPTDDRASALSPRLCGLNECPETVIADEQTYPIAVQVSDKKVFWGNYGDFDDQSGFSGTEGAVYVAPKAGGDAKLIEDGIVGLTGIAVHGQQAYWTAMGPQLYTPGVADGEVGYGVVPRRHASRHSRMGTIPSTMPPQDTLGPSIGHQALFFADYSANAIYWAPLPANSPGKQGYLPGAVIMIENAGGPVDTATDHVYLAWASTDAGKIGIYKLGSRPEPSAVTGQTTAISSPWAVAIQGKYVFWLQNNYPGKEGEPGYLRRVEKEPPRAVKQLAISLLHTPEGLAVDNDHVYWITLDATGYAGQLLRTPIDGGETVVLRDDLSFPAAIAIDNDAVYVAECGLTPGAGRILRVGKYRSNH
jgi:hypothetical protein